MRKSTWSDDEISTLHRRYPDELTENIARDLGRPKHQVYGKAYALGLKKSEVFFASSAAKRLDGKIGAAGRFKKGHIPANKGMKGVCAPGCVPTQFKKGHKPHTWAPIGSERISKEGYLQRKLTDTGVTRRDYVAVHHIIWREAGRDIPQGFRLTFKDGNKKNIVLENLELVSIADMMRRNTIHNYGVEIADLMRLRGQITRQINRRERHV
jgi:hypothetical protein